MAPDYLLFIIGNESMKGYCLAKRMKGSNSHPYDGLLTGAHKDLVTLVKVIVYGIDQRFKAESVGTIENAMQGMAKGMRIEPVDDRVLELFRELYRTEQKLAPIKKQVMSKAYLHN
jgi:hypothetical protein